MKKVLLKRVQKYASGKHVKDSIGEWYVSEAVAKCINPKIKISNARELPKGDPPSARGN